MRRYHHIGIPTATVQADEIHLEEYGMYVSGLEQSPYSSKKGERNELD